MNKRTLAGLSILGGVTAAGLYWRLVARKHFMPCPPWLTVLLENPYMNAVAGAEAILDRINIAPGMRLLDAGCGPGRLTVPAARRVGSEGSVTAVDLQPEMLRRAKAKADQAGMTNIQFIQSPLGAGQIAADQYDRVILITVLGEIPDRAAAMAELFRALKPGGILSVTEVLPDPHYQTRSTVRKLATTVGFKEYSIHGNLIAFTLNFVKPDDRENGQFRLPELTNISKTLLFPLFMRAHESSRPNPLIRDEMAVKLAIRLQNNTDGIRPIYFGSIFPLLRTHEMDNRVRAFLADHPTGTVVDLGCGIDTRFYRVDNGQVTWFNLDLPEVITLRRHLLDEPSRCTCIAQSVLDLTWIDIVQHQSQEPYLFISEGVFPYLEKQEVQKIVTALCERFPGSTLVFDALDSGFIRLSRFHPVLRATHARLAWGIDDGKDIESWHPDMHLQRDWRYFDNADPRLWGYRLFSRFAPLGNNRVVELRLGTVAKPATLPALEHA